MKTAVFSRRWATWYPKSPPLPYLLRKLHPEYWFRIHSLADSKRYPEDETDWETLLARQHTVLLETLGSSKRLLLTGYYAVKAQPVPPQFLLEQAVPEGFSFTALPPIAPDEWEPGSDEPDALLYWPMLTAPLPANTPVEALLRAVAVDECRAAFLEPEKGILVAPYAGGIDIFIPSVPARDYYQQKYRSWLSTRPDGL